MNLKTQPWALSNWTDVVLQATSYSRRPPINLRQFKDFPLSVIHVFWCLMPTHDREKHLGSNSQALRPTEIVSIPG